MSIITKSPSGLSTPQLYPDPIPGIIPFRTLTLLAGAPGAGKTALLAMMFKALRDGEPIFGHQTNPPPGGLYYISADRGGTNAREWFEKVGFPEIPHYALADDLDVDLNQDLRDWKATALLNASLNKLMPPPGSVVGVDPYSPLYICGDSNRLRDVAKSLLAASRICAERLITLIVTAHQSKQRADEKSRYYRPQDRIAGSTAFAGFSDTQMYLETPRGPKSPHYTFGWVPRHRPPEEFQLRKNDRGLFDHSDLFTEMDRRQKAWEVVPDEKTPASVICKRISTALGVGHEPAFEYLKSLVSDGRVARVGKGLYQRKQPS